MLSRAIAGRPRQVLRWPSVPTFQLRSTSAKLDRNVSFRRSFPRASSLSTLACRSTLLQNNPILLSLRNETLVPILDGASNSPLFQHQIRWKRKGGASAFSKPRPPTRKQRKKYHRRKRKLEFEKVGKHSPPGFKAGKRREFADQQWQELLDWNKPENLDPKRLEYDFGDALRDDLIGNTADYTSAPNPEPKYLGHKHKQYYNRVRREMEQFRLQKESEYSEDATNKVMNPAALPSDSSISLVLRAYRDRHGTKHRPIGVAKALQHLLRDLKLPVSAFGEQTYTSLLTCCRTPKEARRIFRLMNEHQHDISAYSWSILVDIHAKLGDPEGCDAVLKEMVAEGVPPTMAAYTSLLAACYKVCNSGHVPHSVRAKTGELGWNRWKEMRIVGLEPDVMAYGALLRLCAAWGHPERAINVLEEMQVMEVKPTTLCFTSALRAVSRSQQTAVWYQQGSSGKNRRREQITAHHGNLAQKILIMAESAEVEQDEGFVAALIMCAGASGDSATAKAIYLASKVRKMDHLRPIGSSAHLESLQQLGVDDTRNDSTLAIDAHSSERPATIAAHNTNGDVSSSGSDLSLLSEGGLANRKSEQSARHVPSYEEREYGKDTRILSALMFACSQAMGSNGLGTMWAGRENKGYLCDNSLRLLTARPKPKYYDKSIPGISSSKVGMGTIKWEDEPEVMGKRLRRAKFQGLQIDDSAGTNIEDIDEMFFDMVKDEAIARLHGGSENTPKSDGGSPEIPIGPTISPDEVNFMDGGTQTTVRFDASTGTISRKDDVNSDQEMIQTPQIEGTDEEWYFDDDMMRWRTRPRQQKTAALVNAETDEPRGLNRHDNGVEYYSDYDKMRWGTRPKTVKAPITPFEAAKLLEEDRLAMANEAHETHEHKVSVPSTEGGFQQFLKELRKEIKESGESIDVDEEEARELFRMATKEYPEIGANWDELQSDRRPAAESDFDSFYAQLKDEWETEGFKIDEEDAREMFNELHGTNIASGDDTPSNERDTPDSYSEAEFSEKPDKRQGTESDFDSFYAQLKDEWETEGFKIEEEDAREMFNEMQGTDIASGEDTPSNQRYTPDSFSETEFSEKPDKLPGIESDFNSFYAQLKNEWETEGFKIEEEDARDMFNEMQGTDIASGDDTPFNERDVPDYLSEAEFREKSETDLSKSYMSSEHVIDDTSSVSDSIIDGMSMLSEPATDHTFALKTDTSTADTSDSDNLSTTTLADTSLNELDTDDLVDASSPKDHALQELQDVLPGLPMSRIERIYKVFRKSLGTPSMIRLVPLLREHMPEYVNVEWLRQKNLQNAYFVMRQAAAEDAVDIHMLNGLLQVKTSAGGIDSALSCHAEQFSKFNVTPTFYSDRLVLQMLVRNHRLSRALEFKQRIEEAGRNLDAISYGSLIEYYSRRGHFGSAMMLLRECVSIHGSPPADKSLTHLRLLGRQKDLVPHVEGLAGKDPLEWFRYGEANFKREMSYKGRRDVKYAQNRLLDI